MKVALVQGKMFKNGNFSGAAKSVINLFNEFKKFKIDAYVVCPDNIKLFNEKIIIPAEMTYIPFSRLDSLNPIKIAENIYEACSLLKFYLLTTKKIQKNNFEIIDNQGFWSAYQDVLTVRYCISLYLSFTNKDSLKQKILWFFDARMKLLNYIETKYFTEKRFKRVIVNCNRTKNYLIDKYKIDPDIIKVIPNGFLFFNKRLETKKLNALFKELNPQNKMVVMFVGLNPKRKNIELFFKVMNKFTNCIGLCVGLPISNLRNYQIPSNVKVVEYASDIEYYYKMADIFVFPTVYDESPKVVLEAMASGLCVITSINSGCQDYIKNGRNGYILPLSDFNFIKKLEMLLLNPEKVKIVGAMAKDSVKNMTWENSAKKRLEIYKKVLAEKSKIHR